MFRQVVIRLAALNVAVLIVIVGLVLAAVFFGARYGLQRDVDRDLRQAGRQGVGVFRYHPADYRGAG